MPVGTSIICPLTVSNEYQVHRCFCSQNNQEQGLVCLEIQFAEGHFEQL